MKIKMALYIMKTMDWTNPKTNKENNAVGWVNKIKEKKPVKLYKIISLNYSYLILNNLLLQMQAKIYKIDQLRKMFY